MRIPVVRGVIERRILVNYRVRPEVVAPLVPAPFRPKLHGGYGMVGICLIRLCGLRPKLLPSWLGVSSENAAHRTAVEWDDGAGVRQGVYVRRRDTNSRFNALVGGRVFPGYHHHATFDVRETESHFDIRVSSDDGATGMTVVGDVASALPASSIFESLPEASAFYEAGSLGYSATPDGRTYQGLELQCRGWRVEPLVVTSVQSSFFDDRELFPAGSIEFDCALLMRNIDHEWHGRGDLCCDAAIASRVTA